MDIYIHKNGADCGPFTPERIKEGLKHGDFSRSDHAWREGLADWMPLGDVIQSPAPPAPPSSAFKASPPTGKGSAHIFVVRGQTALGPFTATEINAQLNAGVFTAADLAKHSGSETLWPLLAAPGIMRSSLSSPPQIPALGGVPTFGSQRFAGFWVRFAAYMVDVLVMYVPYLVIHSPLTGALSRVRGDDDVAGQLNVVLTSLTTSLIGVCAWWLYSAVAESSAWQGTVGKKLLGLRVTNLAGERISFGQATGRYFSKCVSTMILGIGFLMAAFTERKQALHDFMAGTFVIKCRPPESGGTLYGVDTAPGIQSEAVGGRNVLMGTALPRQADVGHDSDAPATKKADRPRNEGSPTNLIFAVVVVVGLLIAGTLLFMRTRRQDAGNSVEMSTAHESLSRAKQIGLACKLYASDHEGTYPPSLAVLVPTYINSRQLFISPFEPNQAAGYKYTVGLTETMSADTILLEDRYAVERGLRVSVHLDNRGEITTATTAQARTNKDAAADAEGLPGTITTTSNPLRSEAVSSPETSPMHDLIVQRSKDGGDNNGNGDGIWLACTDNSRPPEHLCNHDFRSGDLSFSPGEHWIVVTDGGGSGSSLGTELRPFRHKEANMYNEIPDAGIADRAAEEALRSQHAPGDVELDHVYAHVDGWSIDGRLLKLHVWGNGMSNGQEYVLPPTAVAFDISSVSANYHGGPPPRSEATSSQQTPNSSAAGYSRFTNSRNSYSVMIPAILASNLRETPSTETVTASTADGRTKLLLRVKHGSAGLEALYKQWTAEHTARDPGKVVDYKILRDDWFVVSGFDGPGGYYVKVIVRGSEALFLCLEYDKAGSNLTKDMLTKMSRSFTGNISDSQLAQAEQSAASLPTAPNTAGGLQQRLPNGGVADPYENYAATRPHPTPSQLPAAPMSRIYTVPELKKLVGTRPTGAGLRGDFVLVKREGNQVLLQSRMELSNFGISSTTNGQTDIYRGHTFVTVNCSREMSRFTSGQLVTIPAEQALQIISVSKNSQGEINVEASF